MKISNAFKKAKPLIMYFRNKVRMGFPAWGNPRIGHPWGLPPIAAGWIAQYNYHGRARRLLDFQQRRAIQNLNLQ